jgi:hypothetical protein
MGGGDHRGTQVDPAGLGDPTGGVALARGMHFGAETGVANQVPLGREAFDRADGRQDRHGPHQPDAGHLDQQRQALIGQ